MTRIHDIELAFRTGFDSAWSSSGEGRNAEYCSRLPDGSIIDVRAMQDDAWAHYRAVAGGALVASPLSPVIDRLLAEAAPLLDASGNPVPGQTPALECMVMFTSGHTIRGALSRTPEGILRMLSPGMENGRGVLVEQFFDDDAVSSVALVREIKTDARRLVVPAGSVIS
jgi:hypothetical protein